MHVYIQILLQQIIYFQLIKSSIDVRGMRFIWHELLRVIKIKTALNCYWNVSDVIKSIQEVAREGFVLFEN